MELIHKCHLLCKHRNYMRMPDRDVNSFFHSYENEILQMQHMFPHFTGYKKIECGDMAQN